MFHDTRVKNPNKYLRLLSCVIYTIIDNYVCIDYLACQPKQLSEIYLDSKYVQNYFNIIFGIGIQYLLMNLFLCNDLSKNIESIVILKFPKRMLEYYFPKGFGILECNSKNLTKIPNLVKRRIHSEETHN